MWARLGTLSRSPRVREAVTYPFRLQPYDSDWRSTPFTGLAVVNNISGAGDALVTVALAGSVFVSVSLHAARGRTALGLIATVLPFAVVGPFVGPFIDRVRGGRRFIVLLAALGRLAACLMMSAWIHSLLLFPAAFFSLVCSKTHTVASSSLVPGVVEQEEDLVRANSRLAVGSSVVTSIAAVIGSGIYKALGSKVLLDFDVLVFAAVAALSLSLLGRRVHPAVAVPQPSSDLQPPEEEEPAAVLPSRPKSLALGSSPSTLRSLHLGGRYRRHPRRPRPRVPRELALAQVAMAGMRMAAGLLTALIIFDFRGQHAPVIWYGLVAIASVGGNFGGALIAPHLRHRISERNLVGGAALVIGATAIVVTRMAEMHRRPAALILGSVVALGASSAKTAFDAIVQRETLDTDRSRLFARFGSIFQLVWVVGALIPTLISTSLLVGFILTAVIVIATSAVFVIGMLGRSSAPALPAVAPPD